MRWWRRTDVRSARTAAMRDCLDGLSVGDAVGAQFFLMGRSVEALLAGRYSDLRWEWTDDTEMACSVVDELHRHGGIDPQRLAVAFARRWDARRDYGFATTGTLRRIGAGESWRTAAGALFEGAGSCGNGAAMRVAPLGAYFADDPERVVAEAVRSAQVTHLHPEGIAGAVAVALAAARAARARRDGDRPDAREFLTEVLDRIGPGETGAAIRRARELVGCTIPEAVDALGNGSRVLAQDTVPLTLWIAATHLDDYPSAIATCVRAGGDMDTTAAIVGGIVAAHTGIGAVAGRLGVPPEWIGAREPLPAWATHAERSSGPARGW